MLVLVPPSEGKAIGGDDIWTPDDGRFGDLLGPRRRRVVDALVGMVGDGDERTRSRLLGARGARLGDATRDALALPLGPPALRAAERYTGVVWSHLGVGDLPRKGAAWVDAHVVVVSGLLGLVGAADPVPAYRLKMSVSLGALGKLSRWWRPGLDHVLDGQPVVDLLPREHADAAPPRGGTWASVRFVTPSGGAAGHHGKAAKGAFARHLALGAPSDIDGAIELARTFPDSAAVEVDRTENGWQIGVILDR